MSNESLKSQAAKGIAWSSFGTFSGQGINFVIGVMLARILAPSDYGLIGMLAIFFALSQLFVESGFSNALIQKIDRTEEDYSTVFYFNILVSLLCYLILFFAAPLIARFYNVPELLLLTRILSLSILINSLTVVQQARLSINLDFKTPALISFFSLIISGLLGVYLAYHGAGVWALVIQTLSAALIRTVSFFYFNRWMPKFVFSISSLKTLFRFSSNLLAAGLVANIVNNLYSILIGKFFNPKDVGFYTRARQFPEVLSSTISVVLQGVTYPILTSLQNDRDRMVAVYGRLMRITVFFVMPLLTLFALLAEPFIRLVLTEKWISIVPLIQWMCFARMITPISSLNMNILNAIGRSDLYFKTDISKVPLTIVFMIMTVPLGLKAVVIGHFAVSFICYFVNAYYPGKLFKFGAVKQIKEMRLVVFSTLIMVICVYLVKEFLADDLCQLLLCIPVGIASYLISAYLVKIEEFGELAEISKIAINRIKMHRQDQII